MQRWAVLGLLALFCAAAVAEIKLELAGQIHLATSYSDGVSGGTYGYDKGVAEQMTADIEANVIYVVGENSLMQVVDVAKADAMKVLAAVDVGGKATDVEMCGDYVAVGVGKGTSAGMVHIFKKYAAGTEMSPLYTLTTGPLPDMIKFTKNCQYLFTANEGEGALEGGAFVNPEGSISVFTWTAPAADAKADLSKEPKTSTITFTDIAGGSKGAALWKEGKGVQWAFGPHSPGFPTDKFPASERTFIKSLEPEYLALNNAEDRLYVCLQETSAIAEIKIKADEDEEDFTEMKVLNIYPLKPKYYNYQAIDASDKDGKINRKAWGPGGSIVGQPHPDSIVSFKVGVNDYIAMANEGDAVEYCEGSGDDETCYAGDTRMGKVVDNLGEKLAEDEDLVEAMKDDKKLGRLKLDISGSLTKADGKYTELHTLSTRSVSIYRAENMIQMWDSGDDVEILHEKYLPKIFNSDGAAPGDSQEDEFDKRSDDKGAEVETLAVCEIDGRMLLFVGCERTSTILTYDVSSPMFPTWQSIISLSGQDKIPAELKDGSSTAAPQIGVVDPEGMYCDAANKRLIVSGAVSGVVAIYNIAGRASAAATTTYSVFSLVAATVLSLYAVMRQ